MENKVQEIGDHVLFPTISELERITGLIVIPFSILKLQSENETFWADGQIVTKDTFNKLIILLKNRVK